MKVVILHHDLEWSEKQFLKVLKERNIPVVLKDVRKVSLDEILAEKPSLVMNRVYASVANRDYQATLQTLALLRELDVSGTQVLNNYEASRSDYSKYHSYKKMVAAGVNTPKTWLLEEFPDDSKYPVVVKRDSGGRGKDLRLVHNAVELSKAVQKIRSDVNYFGDIIVQEFIRPVTEFDYRIGLFGNSFLYGNRRTLITNGSDIKWLASRSRGSELLKFDLSKGNGVIELAKQANRAVGAMFNVLDIMVSIDGYKVIENNQTPNYRTIYYTKLGFSPVDIITNKLVNMWNGNENRNDFKRVTEA